MIEAAAPMTRGRLCELSKSKSGGSFYHLQYRRNTKLFQKYIPLAEVAAYEKSTKEFQKFMEAVDMYIDELSEKTMNAIKKEAKNVRRKSEKKAR